MDKYDYIDLLVNNDMWGIIYQRFLELSEGRSDIDQSFLSAAMMKQTEIIGTKPLMELYRQVKDYYNNKFQLTFITFKDKFIMAGSSEDFLITKLPPVSEVPTYTFE